MSEPFETLINYCKYDLILVYNSGLRRFLSSFSRSDITYFTIMMINAW